jgi:hypothetical protein
MPLMPFGRLFNKSRVASNKSDDTQQPKTSKQGEQDNRSGKDASRPRTQNDPQAKRPDEPRRELGGQPDDNGLSDDAEELRRLAILLAARDRAKELEETAARKDKAKKDALARNQDGGSWSIPR